MSKCIEWPGAKNDKGYGRLFQDGEETKAHRAIFEALHGPIPDGLVVIHTCDNPPCINPAHLMLGTPLENVADCIQKGRRRYVTRDAHPFAKLRTIDAKTVLGLRAVGKTIAELASIYGVSKSTMHAFLKWSGCRDSNSGPPAPEAGALPGCATPRRICASGTDIGKKSECFQGRALRPERS